jgi:hypothetical protein
VREGGPRYGRCQAGGGGSEQPTTRNSQGSASGGHKKVETPLVTRSSLDILWVMDVAAEFVRQINSILTPGRNSVRHERSPVTPELRTDPPRGGCRSAGWYEALLKQTSWPARWPRLDTSRAPPCMMSTRRHAPTVPA